MSAPPCNQTLGTTMPAVPSFWWNLSRTTKWHKVFPSAKLLSDHSLLFYRASRTIPTATFLGGVYIPKQEPLAGCQLKIEALDGCSLLTQSLSRQMPHTRSVLSPTGRALKEKAITWIIPQITKGHSASLLHLHSQQRQRTSCCVGGCNATYFCVWLKGNCLVRLGNYVFQRLLCKWESIWLLMIMVFQQ